MSTNKEILTYVRNTFNNTLNYVRFATYNKIDLPAGAAITDGVGDAAAAADRTADPSVAACTAANLTANAYNTYASDGDAANEVYLPAATKGTICVVQMTGDQDAANATTFFKALLGTDVFAKQVIAAETPNTLAATIPTGCVSAVLTPGTVATPTGTGLIYTPAAASTNFLFTNSELWFYCPHDGQWLCKILAVGETTSATGALTMSTA